MNAAQALLYHRRHKPEALLALARGKTLVEQYDGGLTEETPHALYSGTKSFWGVTAVTAQAEGLIQLDEPVWNGATMRQLLNLTAGVPFGGLGSAVPPYEKALATLPNDAPGSRFTYGGIPLQIFGALFRQKLEPLGMTPHDYLHDRIVAPAKFEIAKWRILKDGTNPLPTGAFLTARNWARYGVFVLKNRERFMQCFAGSQANPRYGLAWWLEPKSAPPGTFYASGSGGQAMYVVPAEDLVVVRFGGGGSYNHEAFLKKAFS